MASIFSRIVNGEIPSYKIAETDDYYAFLDINPMVIGHTLVIPKKEVDFIFDVEDELLSGLMVFAKKVAHAIDAAIPCKRVGLMVVGTEVPHAHIHLIPFQRESEMNIAKSKMALPADEMQQIAAAIRAKL
ncbi:MAG: HIT family protein [Saprospiraceae bacterium]|nr:MAG: HIT family protein [Saprospiraceae bacterium]